MKPNDKQTPRPPATSRRTVKLRVQPDRLPGWERHLLRAIGGGCPACLGATGNEPIFKPAVIFRRGKTSLTFKCQTCKLKWPVTFRSLQRAAGNRATELTKAGIPADDPRLAIAENVAEGLNINWNRPGQLNGKKRWVSRLTGEERAKEKRLAREARRAKAAEPRPSGPVIRLPDGPGTLDLQSA